MNFVCCAVEPLQPLVSLIYLGEFDSKDKVMSNSTANVKVLYSSIVPFRCQSYVYFHRASDESMFIACSVSFRYRVFRVLFCSWVSCSSCSLFSFLDNSRSISTDHPDLKKTPLPAPFL